MQRILRGTNMAIITLGAGQKYKFTSSGSNLQFKEGTDHPLGMTIASGGLQAHGNLEIISGSAVFDGPISSSAPVRLSGLGGTYPSSGQVKTVFIQEDGTIQLGQVGSQTVDSGSGNIFTSDGNLVASRRLGLTSFNLAIKPGAFDAGTATLFVGGDATYDNKVGINTETPSEALEVIGTISASTDIYAGGDIFCEGIVTADEFHTTIISTSVNFSTGNTEFGDESSDLHRFTGSVEISGNLTVTDDDSLFQGMVSMSSISTSLGIVTHGPISGTSTLDITGNTNLDGTLEIASDITASANMVVGGSGSFTLLSASGDFDITGDIRSTGDIDFTGDRSITTTGATDDLSINPKAVLYLGSAEADAIIIGRTSGTGGAGRTEIYANTSTIAAKFQESQITFNHPITSSADIVVAGSGSFTALSSSGIIHGKANIIANNDISASGNIIAAKAHINTPLTFTANTNADELVIGNGVGNKGISIYSGDTSTGGIFFASDLDEEGAGDNPAGNRHGVFNYDHNNDEFNLNTGGNQAAATIGHGGSTIHSNLDVSGTGSFTGGGIFGVGSRVGIGTTSPSVTLDVRAQNTLNSVALFRSDDDKALITIADDDTNIALIAKDAKFHIGTGSTDYENFTVWPTEKRVGINTTDPGQALEVIGEVSASSTGSFEFLTVSQSITAAHVEATTFGEINTTAVTASLGLVTDGPVSASGTGSFGALNVTGSGKFGGPVTIFHPNTADMARTRLSVGRSALESIQFDVNDTVHQIVSINDLDSNTTHELRIGLGTPSSGDQKIKFFFADENNSSQANVMTLTDETRVGIGTSTPGATLHVNGIV